MFKILPAHKQKLVNYYLRRVQSVEPVRPQPTLKQKTRTLLRDFEREVKLSIDDEDDNQFKTQIGSDKLKMRMHREKELRKYHEHNDDVYDHTVSKIQTRNKAAHKGNII